MKIVPKPIAEDRIEEFIALYVRLRDAAGPAVLSRHHLTMRDVAPYAADITIVELVSDEEWIVRLNGTGHCDHAGIDRTGVNVLEGCGPEERALRRAIAQSMFDFPCGVSAIFQQTYDEGSTATLDAASLPLLGRDGEKLILSYALLVEDIEDPFGDRPVLQSVKVTGHRYKDLGFGVPE